MNSWSRDQHGDWAGVQRGGEEVGSVCRQQGATEGSAQWLGQCGHLSCFRSVGSLNHIPSPCPPIHSPSHRTPLLCRFKGFTFPSQLVLLECHPTSCFWASPKSRTQDGADQCSPPGESVSGVPAKGLEGAERKGVQSTAGRAEIWSGSGRGAGAEGPGFLVGLSEPLSCL